MRWSAIFRCIPWSLVYHIPSGSPTFRSVQQVNDNIENAPERALIKQMADLEFLHSNGRINHVEYQKQSALLKKEIEKIRQDKKIFEKD